MPPDPVRSSIILDLNSAFPVYAAERFDTIRQRKPAVLQDAGLVAASGLPFLQFPNDGRCPAGGWIAQGYALDQTRDHIDVVGSRGRSQDRHAGCLGLELDAGAGVRDWETELANETGPAVENFVAGFFAPGLAVAYNLSLPRGSGVFFDFRYVGPTAPFWGVISGVSFPVSVATSIIDPLPSQLADVAFGTPGATFSLTTATPDFGDMGGVRSQALSA